MRKGVPEMLQDVLPMSTYLQEYGNVPVGLMRVDSLRLGGGAALQPRAGAPEAAPPPEVPPPPRAGSSPEGFLGRLQRAESNDEARLSHRLSSANDSTSSRSAEMAPPPQLGASGQLSAHSTSASTADADDSAIWEPPPPILEPRGDEAGVEQVPSPGTPDTSPDSPPPVATRFPDDVGTPKRDQFASSLRGLSDSLSGRPY